MGGAAQRAGELVDAGVAIAGIVGGGARGHLAQGGVHGGIEPGTSGLQHLVEAPAQGEHLGARGEGLVLEQLRRGVARGEALRLGPALAPGGGEAQVHQRGAPVVPDDDVGRLEIAVEEQRAVQPGELIGRAGEGRHRDRGGRVVGDEIGEAPPLDQLAHHVRAAAAGQLAEAEHARHPQPLHAGEGHRLAHQGLHLALVRVLGEGLEGHGAPGDPVPHRPHLAAAALSERRDERIARWQREAARLCCHSP